MYVVASSGSLNLSLFKSLSSRDKWGNNRNMNFYVGIYRQIFFLKTPSSQNPRAQKDKICMEASPDKID